MENIEELIAGLRDSDNTAAHKCLEKLVELSDTTVALWPHFNTFVGMLGDENSYVRTRGLMLIAANAKWDTVGRIDKIIDGYLALITDEKPITARQCIKCLPQIVTELPELKAKVLEALEDADVSDYSDAMRPLVEKDIAAAVETISAIEGDE